MIQASYGVLGQLLLLQYHLASYSNLYIRLSESWIENFHVTFLSTSLYYQNSCVDFTDI